MDFALTDEQVEFKEAVVAFARNEIDPGVEERDRQASFSREIWEKCARFGIQGLPFPTEYGGQGADALTTAVAMEALGYGCRDNGLIFSINAHMWSAALPVLRFGTEDQKKRYLRGLCDGSLIGVQGMTEPDSGSDAYSLKTTVREDGGKFILNGSKTFITNAPVADVFIVFASFDRSMGWAGLSAFIVEKDAPGLEVGGPLEKMGLRTSPMGELFFDECEIPVENALGPKGAGMMIFQNSIEWERGLILASTIGTVERLLGEAVSYANQREQFGQPVGRFQAVSHRLADVRVHLEAARLLQYRLAWKRDQGTVTAVDASMVKLFLSENVVEATLETLKTFGGYGYLVESGLERELRDAMASRIYSGTSDIQRNLIARDMGL